MSLGRDDYSGLPVRAGELDANGARYVLRHLPRLLSVLKDHRKPAYRLPRHRRRACLFESIAKGGHVWRGQPGELRFAEQRHDMAVAKLSIGLESTAIAFAQFSRGDPRLGGLRHANAGAIGRVDAGRDFTFRLDTKCIGIAAQIELTCSGFAVLIDIAHAPSFAPLAGWRFP